MSEIDLAPILLFVYNRLDFLQKTILSLQKNFLAPNSELFIFSDGAKNEIDLIKVNEVRNYIKKIDGFKKVKIFENNNNSGLADSIINGVTRIVNVYGKVIVLEDDLVTSPYFLSYMNKALEMYKEEKNVASIHGYIYPIENLPNSFFIRGADCWGWGTWKDRWLFFEYDGKKLLNELVSRGLQKVADFENTYSYTKMLKNQIQGKNDSWAIRWYMSTFLKGMLTLYPGVSYVHNIGFGKDSTHCKIITDIYNTILNNDLNLKKINVSEDLLSRKKIEKYFYKNFVENRYKNFLNKFLNVIR